MLFTCLWLLPPQMCLPHAPVAPSPDVTTMGRHIQLRSLHPRDAPTSRCPPHIQCVLFAYRCVSHSLVANSQKCHQYSSVAPPPIYSYHPPTPYVCPSSSDGLHCPIYSPMSGCASPPHTAPSQPAPASPTPRSPARRCPTHLHGPTQLCLSPPPDVHPSRPSPLTYPPRSGVHLPQCPAPSPARPLFPGCRARIPASLPAVPRAAASIESCPFPASHFSDPQPNPPTQSEVRLGPFPGVLCGRACLTSPPFLDACRREDYNSQRPS